MKEKEIKNKIILYYSNYEEENPKTEKHELYNFSKLDHYKDTNTGKFYIRILCDNRFYYFNIATVVISEIEIY